MRGDLCSVIMANHNPLSQGLSELSWGGGGTETLVSMVREGA